MFGTSTARRRSLSRQINSPRTPQTPEFTPDFLRMLTEAPGSLAGGRRGKLLGRFFVAEAPPQQFRGPSFHLKTLGLREVPWSTFPGLRWDRRKNLATAQVLCCFSRTIKCLPELSQRSGDSQALDRCIFLGSEFLGEYLLEQYREPWLGSPIVGLSTSSRLLLEGP